jgi:hypothetical protein
MNKQVYDFGRLSLPRVFPRHPGRIGASFLLKTTALTPSPCPCRARPPRANRTAHDDFLTLVLPRAHN